MLQPMTSRGSQARAGEADLDPPGGLRGDHHDPAPLAGPSSTSSRAGPARSMIVPVTRPISAQIRSTTGRRGGCAGQWHDRLAAAPQAK